VQHRAAAEHLDVPGFIRGLHGEQLHHFAEVRVKLAEQPSRDDERRLFVLDQVGHDLHHSARLTTSSLLPRWVSPSDRATG
jgi:hypothetical protein